MTALHILSGGAANGLVVGVSESFKLLTGLKIEGHYGAVGVMADKLRAGTPADILILTNPLIETLGREGLADLSTAADIGLVETSIAVRKGDQAPAVADFDHLREAFRQADAIFVPDIKASTAGIHVASVLAKLGIADEVAARLQVYPNGQTAMRHLAESKAKKPIGCTQSTEILSTSGITLVAPLPKGCELATIYTAAVATKATRRQEAQTLIGLLTGAAQKTLRARAGFLEIES